MPTLPGPVCLTSTLIPSVVGKFPVADSRYAQFAASDPGGSDAAFWEQKVFFDGVPRRRREIVRTLAATPYMTERAARLLLTTAPVADGQPAARPPAAWFTGTIPTPGAGHLEDEDDGLDDDDKGPQHNHLPIIG
jgi:hypothetical protein